MKTVAVCGSVLFVLGAAAAPAQACREYCRGRSAYRGASYRVAAYRSERYCRGGYYEEVRYRSERCAAPVRVYETVEREYSPTVRSRAYHYQETGREEVAIERPMPREEEVERQPPSPEARVTQPRPKAGGQRTETRPPAPRTRRPAH